jgi:hypothetical protein
MTRNEVLIGNNGSIFDNFTEETYFNGRHRRTIVEPENQGVRKRGKIAMRYLIIHSPERGCPRSLYDPVFAYLSLVNDR